MGAVSKQQNSHCAGCTIPPAGSQHRRHRLDFSERNRLNRADPTSLPAVFGNLRSNMLSPLRGVFSNDEFY